MFNKTYVEADHLRASASFKNKCIYYFFYFYFMAREHFLMNISFVFKIYKF